MKTNPLTNKPKVECPSLEGFLHRTCAWNDSFCNLLRGKRCAYFELNLLSGASQAMKDLYAAILKRG